MQLTDLQLQIQEYSDKTISFGCMFLYNYDWDDDDILTFCSIFDDTGNKQTLSYLGPEKDMTHEIDMENFDELVILGHPMNWGRLCYLLSQLDTVDQSEKWFASKNLLGKIERWLGNNREFYQQTVLERPEELQKLVLEFLLTLPR